MPKLVKNEKGFNFKYANPSLVLGTLNPLLNEEGVFLKSEIVSVRSERVEVKTKSGEKTETLYHLDMLFTWVDVEDGEEDSCRWSASGMNGDEQGLGSALTYAERYFMLKFFNIPTDEDDPDALTVKKKGGGSTTQQPKQDPKRTISVWMTEEQFTKTMECKDVKKVEMAIAAYSAGAKGMKKEYRTKLVEHLEELKNNKNETHESEDDAAGTGEAKN